MSDNPEDPNNLHPPPKSRAHHYVFAHQVLRAACTMDPFRFFAAIGSEAKTDFIEHLWSLVCQNCDERETTTLTAADIRVDAFGFHGYPTVFVTMPETIGITEAIFVVIVLTADLEIDAPPDQVDHRYFTLEQGMNLDGTNRTVFCEWQGGDHLNMGDGGDLDENGFLTLVATQLPTQSNL